MVEEYIAGIEKKVVIKTFERFCLVLQEAGSGFVVAGLFQMSTVHILASSILLFIVEQLLFFPHYQSFSSASTSS